MSGTPQIAISMVGINAPGYRSLALDYLHAAVVSDVRFDVAVNRHETSTDVDAWWIAYHVLTLDPAPQVLAMPVLCWTAGHAFDVARLVKNERPDILVVLGGPEVGPIAVGVMEAHPYIDVVVRGEGEVTFSELIHSWSRGGDIAGVQGCCVRQGHEILCAPDRDEIEDLDQIASPHQVLGVMPATGFGYIETYRGCPHRCAYCYEGKGSTRIRSFGWERIKADIDAVAVTPGLKAFSFVDPVFNLTRDRLGMLADILEPYARRGMRLHTIEVDIERVDAEQAAQMVRAGIVSVETGPQTTGTAALTACARTFDADRFRAGVEACKAAGISVECDFIIGLPGDTVEDVYAGLEFALEVDPGIIQLSTLHVLPGTTLWDEAETMGVRFDRVAPHEVISTRELGFAELRRLEVLGKTISQCYAARLTSRRGSTA